jgi:hypothetical protein
MLSTILVKAWLDWKLNYTHVEKLTLAVVHVVQWFHHYILLRKTTVIAIINPFQYVLTRWVIGGKISRWIVILQEFDLDFVSAKSKNSLVFVELISNFQSKVVIFLPKSH